MNTQNQRMNAPRKLQTLRILVLAVLLAGLPILGFAQSGPNWENWSWLVGDWKGEGSGQPGQGSGNFSLQFDLNKKILVRKNHSEYPAAAGKPAAVHDDLMIVYPESGTSNKAIYFDNEGHVIHYTASFADKSITLLSAKAPNQPVFRLTYTQVDSKTVSIRFEMSQDGTTFRTYLEGKCVKS
jgi:hypothetical protein